MARHDEAFTAFADARSTALMRVAFWLCGDRHQAQDLLQQALAKTYVAWPRLRDPQAAEAYCRRAIVTTNISWWRRPARQQETVTSSGQIPDHGHHDSTEAAAERDRMLRALARLAPRQRAVVVLRYYEDLSDREIADTLGLAVGTVKSHASRGLGQLRALLGTPEADEFVRTPEGGQR